MIIQEYASRFETIKATLSNLAWHKRGINNFILEDLPFSFSTGKYWASIVSEFLKIQAKTTTKSLKCYELGAGAGYLAKHILDHIKKHTPKLYQKLQYYLSDYSPLIIEELKRSKPYHAHRKQIHYDITDFTKPDQTQIKNADFIHMTYLIDALPSRQIEVAHGRCYEIQIQTEISDRAYILDTRRILPKILKAKSIVATLLSNRKTDKLNLLAPKIMPLLKERYRRVPITKCKNMTNNERTILQTFADTLPHTRTWRFNFSFSVYRALSQLIASLKDTGAILIFDYGYSQIPGIEKSYKTMVQSYGLNIFAAICSPYIQFIAQKNKAECLHFSVGKGKAQILLISKTPQRYQAIFKKNFTPLFRTQNAVQLKKTIKKLNQVPLTPKTIQRHLSVFPPLERDSYYICLHLGLWLIEKNEWSLAEYYLKKIMTDYEKLGLLAYTALGQIYSKKNDPKTAEFYFNKALKQCPHYAIILNELAFLHVRQKNYSCYIHFAKAYIKHVTEPTIWGHLITISMIYLILKKPDESKKIVTHICRLYHTSPSVPKFIYQKARALL